MKFALVGNPNCGKTTLFNTLTGSTAHVGNWPGVTVDRKEGLYKKLSEPVTIVDLPGIYSLSPYTPEEIIARNFILDDDPQLIINIIDATNLERNLYLTTQLLEIDCPMIVALNMMDVLARKNAKIDLPMLEDALGVPVVSISALRSDGIKILMEKAYEASKSHRKGISVFRKTYLGEGLKKMEALLMENDSTKDLVFHSVKLLEGDAVEVQTSANILAEAEEIKKAVPLRQDVAMDFEAAVADLRYQYIEKYYIKSVQHNTDSHGFSTSDKIDLVLTNKWLGIPIFLFFMLLVFNTTFGTNWLGIPGLTSPGHFLNGLMELFTATTTQIVTDVFLHYHASDWVLGLVVDGLLAGLMAVLSFLPQILLLFLFLSIMEDSGYMSRAAFLMDQLLRNFGLSGKAFMPLLMGFGCSVPAIMGTRTLDSDKDRRMTIMLIIGFSCGAKLPTWALFADALFPAHADFMILAVYGFGIFAAVVAGIVLKHTMFKQEAAPFVMELPAYHMPRVKNLAIHLWDKLKGFLIRATTIIAGTTVIIWFMANFNFRFEMVEANSAGSILGVIGNLLVPLLMPLGFVSGPDGWKNVVAILTGLIAKEMVVATMGVLYNPGMAGDALADDSARLALLGSIGTAFSPAAAFSFMVFNLLCVPCMAAVATAHGELKHAKWTGATIGFWLVLAYLSSLFVYWIAHFFGF